MAADTMTPTRPATRPYTDRDFRQGLANKFVEQLRDGTSPLQNPPPAGINPTPFNPVSGRTFSGANHLQLRLSGYQDPRWLTYNQAKENGWMVRHGEKATKVQHWTDRETRDKLDLDGKPILGADGKPEQETVKLQQKKVVFYGVFNAEQIEGIPEMLRTAPEVNPVERVQGLVDGLNFAKVANDALSRPTYNQTQDVIHMPPRNTYKSEEEYCDALLSGATFGTGSRSRLDRNPGTPGSQEYSAEKLRTELATMMIADEIGLPRNTERVAPFVGDFVKFVENHPLELLRAASAASYIADYMFERELTHERQEVVEKTPVQTQEAQRQVITPEVEPTREAEPRPAPARTEPAQAIHQETAAPTREEPTRQQGPQPTPPAVEPTQEEENRIEFPAATTGKFKITTFTDKETGTTLYGVAAHQQPGDLDHYDVWKKLKTFKNQQDAQNFLNEAERQFSDTEQAITQTEQLRETPAPEPEPEVSAAAETQVAEPAPSLEQRFGQIDIPVGSIGAFEVRGCLVNEEDGEISSHSLDNTQKEDLADFDKFGVYTLLDDESDAHLKDFDTIEEAKEFAREADRQYAANVAKLAEAELKDRPLDSPQAAKSPQAGQSRYNSDDPGTRTYINVPKEEKDEAKTLGAKWDKSKYSWYIPGDVEKEPFAKWQPKENTQEQQGEKKAFKREYIHVPAAESKEAEQAGAKWDQKNRSYYVMKEDKEAVARCEKWRGRENKPDRCSTEPVLSPEEEFRAALVEKGARPEATRGHPIADGEFHRIEEDKDKSGEKSMSYKYFSDGHPAGFIMNNRTGEKTNWKAKGYNLSDEKKAELQATAETKLEERSAAEENSRQEEVKKLAERLEFFAKQNPGQIATAYTEAKGIEPHAGVYRHHKDDTLVVPAYNSQGELQSAQYVNSDGKKNFVKGTTKTGAFHVIGHGKAEALKDAPAIVIAEGYATAATVSEAVGFPTVSAFDAGNLLPVAKALRQEFPDKPIIFAADDDAHQKFNPGKNKAYAAAKEVGGYVALPRFDDAAKAKAEEAGKHLTDFNDLAQSHPEGKDMVKRQITNAMDKERSQAARAQFQERPQEKAQEVGMSR